MYNRVAPTVVNVTIINVPHHLPKTKPEKNSKGLTGAKINTQRIEKIKKIIIVSWVLQLVHHLGLYIKK